VLVVIDAAIFKALYRDEKSFKALIDAQYKERAHAAHLRVVPLFKYLSERELDSIQKGVEFLDVPENTTVVKQGDAVDAVYLVRSGAVKVTQRDERGTQRILSYLMENSSFGESSAAGGDARWPGAYETMARTNIVKVPLGVLDKLRADSPGTLLTRTAELIAQQETRGTSGVFDLLDRAAKEATPGTPLSRERLEIMVSKQSVKGGHALVIDLTKCVRCNACVESCVAVHADRVPRLSKTGSRVSTQKTLASACYHCEIPECMMACGYGAIRRDLRGSIEFFWDNCVGCTSCVMGCPYNVIRMTPPPDQMASPDDVSVLATLPVIGRWFRSKSCSTPRTESAARTDGAPLKQYNKVTGKEETVSGKAIKCDLCAGMPFEACVYNCPCAAILRVAPEDIFEGAG
jgi:Fe-S-cluster-containing hydrogenase component 2